MTIVVAENVTQLASNVSCSNNATVAEADMDCSGIIKISLDYIILF
jgi:hypothetical protein